MTEYKMLGETICYCSKCKLDLNHRIVLMDGNMPARVLCLTCQTERKFKKTRPQGSEATTAYVRRHAGATPSLKAKARQSSEEDAWRKKLENQDVTPVRYNMDLVFKPDDHVYHAKFGIGLVVGFDHPDKVHIFFDDGIKILKGKKAGD